MGQNQSGRQTSAGMSPAHLQKHVKRTESNTSSFETLVAPLATSINAEEGEKVEEQDEAVPYTSYSITKQTEEENKAVNEPKSHGIVVVRKKQQPNELAQMYASDVTSKLEKIHIFYPILKSSCGQGNQTMMEEMKDGVEAPPVLNMCLRYQQHLSEVACVIANAQMTLAARFKDLELFVVGIQQQLLRRQERLANTAPHMQTVSEISEVLEKIQGQVDQCVPLMNRLNNLLPETERMEKFEVTAANDYDDPGDAMNYSEQENIIGFNYSNIDMNS